MFLPPIRSIAGYKKFPIAQVAGCKEATMRNESFLSAVSTILAAMVVLTVFTKASEARAADDTMPRPTAQAIWAGLLEHQPYPYLIPIPEPKRTEIDGTYTKVVVAQAERVHCLRCPDYAPEGGTWKLRFDKGAFRIFHQDSRWKSIGTYLVAGNRLLLANDPTCIDGIGLYSWKLNQGQLVLEVIDDPCAIRLRAMNLTQLPWRSCRPPNTEAAVTEHWQKPEGCD
jgi:hypothetical protein